MQIQKGFIISTTTRDDGALTAQVKIDQDDPINNVLLVFPTGFKSNPIGNKDGAMVYVTTLGSNRFGFPFNPLKEPALENGESVFYGEKAGQSITCKANGDIVIEGASDFLAETLKNLNITASEKIILNASEVELGDAVDLVLNESAVMDITIPSGSSAGTYTVNITNAGQTKVKA
jgi:hypothetical protein